MSTPPGTNRTIGFRSRLAARLAPLLAQTRRERPGFFAEGSCEALVAPIAAHVSRLVDALVEGKPLQQATLDRAWLAEHWSLLDHGPCDPAAREAIERVADTERREGKQPAAPYWPGNVSRDDLTQALRRTRDPDASLLADALQKGLLSPQDEDRSLGLPTGGRPLDEAMTKAARTWPLLPCARVIGAYKMVLADLRKPAIAIDAGKVHHELMGGWSRAARAGEVSAIARPDRIELFLPGAENKPAMLDLPLDGERLSEAFVEAIKEWRSFLGLRHWIALQALFSIQGKREGRVLWKLDEHLDALGVSKRWRMDPENRAAVAREVSLLTKMQLVVYRPDGTVRARHSVLMTATEIEVEREGKWLLEGLELQMHPWLYNGVRDQKTGQLGIHWYPVPPGLAKVDHDKFRYSLVLGVILPIRWKWAWAQQGADHITLEADKLLELACIPRSLHDPGRAWEALEANLSELQRIGLLGHVRWEGEPHTTAAKVHLFPADWLLDRTLQGLHPVERALPPPLPSKGADLIAWRKARNLTQTQLAQLWGISDRTIRRAEDAADKPLGRALLNGLQSTVRQEVSTTPPRLLAHDPPAGDIDGEDPGRP